jgi:hypothetical protein
MTNNKDHIASCLSAICDRRFAANPVAWFDLHQAGLTRELLKSMVDAGKWQGPPPVFDKAPAYDDPMWLYMMDAPTP